MLLEEFCNERDARPETVKKYMKRREDEFKKHVTGIGVKTEIDETAFALLDKKYPPKKPVIVVQGIPQEEHNKLMSDYKVITDKYIKLQEELTNTTKQLATEQGRALLIEEKDKRIDDYKEMLDRSEAEMKDAREQLQEAREELERLKNRSFWERLINS